MSRYTSQEINGAMMWHVTLVVLGRYLTVARYVVLEEHKYTGLLNDPGKRDKDQFILLSQYHGYWYTGNKTRQDIQI